VKYKTFSDPKLIEIAKVNKRMAFGKEFYDSFATELNMPGPTGKGSPINDQVQLTYVAPSFCLIEK
jgi:hypothetical protein